MSRKAAMSRLKGPLFKKGSVCGAWIVRINLGFLAYYTEDLSRIIRREWAYLCYCDRCLSEEIVGQNRLQITRAGGSRLCRHCRTVKSSIMLLAMRRSPQAVPDDTVKRWSIKEVPSGGR